MYDTAHISCKVVWLAQKVGTATTQQINDRLMADSDHSFWIVQCFTSLPTQYRLYERRFLQVKRPNQQYQSTEGDATKEKAKNENN